MTVLKKHRLKQSIALVAGVILMLVVGIFSYTVYTDSLDREAAKYAKLVGALRVESNDRLAQSVAEYERMVPLKDQSDRTYVTTSNDCTANIIGYDDKYIYANPQCAVIYKLAETGVEKESSSKIPTRYTYNSETAAISDSVGEAEGNNNPTLESIFPKEIYQIVRPNVGRQS